MTWALVAAPAGALPVPVADLASMDRGDLIAGPRTSDFVTSLLTGSLDLADLVGNVWFNAATGIFTYELLVDPRSAATSTRVGTYSIVELNTQFRVLGFDPLLHRAGYSFEDAIAAGADGDGVAVRNAVVVPGPADAFLISLDPDGTLDWNVRTNARRAGFWDNDARLVPIRFFFQSTLGPGSGAYSMHAGYSSGSVNYAPAVAPVVLVHGICPGGPESFGDMAQRLLSRLGVPVMIFDYAGDGAPIERLAGRFARYVRDQLADPALGGARQVDVVAHSLGGLVARAWVAGLARDESDQEVLYRNEIRRLVMVGTPHYGARRANLNALLKLLDLLRLLDCEYGRSQAEQMRFGSGFLWTLHEQWRVKLREFQLSPGQLSSRDILLIAGTQSSDSRLECNLEGCNDGVVEIASAVLPDDGSIQYENLRYVPYRHGALDFVGPVDGPTLIGVPEGPEGDGHATYRLVEAFLRDGSVLEQCCGPGSVDYDPPHLRGVLEEEEGLLLVRAVDAASGDRIDRRPRLILEPVPPTPTSRTPPPQRNSGTATVWGLEAGVYTATVCVRGYDPGQILVEISPALTTVPEPIRLEQTGLTCR